MNSFDYYCPGSVPDALALMNAPIKKQAANPDGENRVWLAGGQSLLAAMKLGMASPSALLDLQAIPGLRDIRLETRPGGQTTLWIGAMATHASVSRSDAVRDFAPGMASMAGNIADAQVRNMGTLGGSLAHNDPAACWPAVVLAMGATIVTTLREIASDDYFLGLYTTALKQSELILGVRFPKVQGLRYIKFEQPASRFALVGVAVAQTGLPGKVVRVAVTGLGSGVVRWKQAEQALVRFDVPALASLAPAMAEGHASGLSAMGDLHASADYRCHLAFVLTRRCVADLTGYVQPAMPPLAPLAPTARRQDVQVQNATTFSDTSMPPAPVATVPKREGFGGQQRLHASVEKIWQAMLNPAYLRASIPGCESLIQRDEHVYEATVKVGLGPLSVRFKTEVTLSDLRPHKSLTMGFIGNAGALGSGTGVADVHFESGPDLDTILHWWVRVQLSGRLAQLGNRLLEASSRQLSEEFFQRFSVLLNTPEGSIPASASVNDKGRFRVWTALGKFLKRLFFSRGK